MGKVNPGKRFEAKMKASMDAAGMFCMRIPDKVYWNGSRMASEETPADFIACSVGDGLQCYLIECKACSSERIAFARLKRHQGEALESFDSMHGDMHGIVAVNFYSSVSLARLDVCFLVPIAVWREYEAGDMKSLSHADCLKDGRILMCQKGRGGIYMLAGMEAMHDGGSERDGDGGDVGAGSGAVAAEG